MANVRDRLALVQGLIVGCLLSSTVAPLGWPKWLWYTGVIGRSHYNSRGRGVCSLASLYGYESECWSHSFHYPTLIWLQPLTADTVAKPDTLRCLWINLEWEEENRIERSRAECQSICCFVCQTDMMTLLLKLSPRGHGPCWRGGNALRVNKCLDVVSTFISSHGCIKYCLDMAVIWDYVSASVDPGFCSLNYVDIVINVQIFIIQWKTISRISLYLEILNQIDGSVCVSGGQKMLT